MKLPMFEVVSHHLRRDRIRVLVERLEVWEGEGVALLEQLEQLTKSEEHLGKEVRRVLKLLRG